MTAASEGRVTLWMIEVFAAIAETRSISGAAQRVGASTSAASQQLARLEAALQTILVDRAARPLGLTPAGEMFRRRAQNILDEAALARAELAARDLTRLTGVRLGLIEDFDAEVTPRLLASMAEDLAACRFLLETGASHRLIAALGERALDIVVAADIAAAADWMEVHSLMEEPFIAAVPMRGEQPAVEGPDALTRLPLIHYTQRHHMGRMIAAHLARQNIAPTSRFELDSYHAILAMVAEGVGWTILTPLGLMSAKRFETRVAVVPLPGAPLSRTIALWARRGTLGAIPADTAARLRLILQEHVVAPAIARLPWTRPRLRVLADPVDPRG